MDAREATKTMRFDLPALGKGGDETSTQCPWDPARINVSKASARANQPLRTHDFAMLLESVYDGVLITDLEGWIRECNSRIPEFFRCTPGDLKGKLLLDLISGADDSMLESIYRNLEDHRYTLIEGRCIRKDLTMFPAEIAVNKIDLDGGTQLCVLIRDITVRRKAQDALEAAVVRLEGHDRARLQFVSNVSHELKTPLTSMIYAVNNMLTGVVGPLPDRAKSYLEILRGDCKRLLSTVNDILDLRKIETKTLSLAKSRVPFARLVRQSVGSLRIQARQQSIDLRMQADSYAWFVECDPAKMERVILNIVGNAIKFTPEGGKVEVSVQSDRKRAGNVVLSVRDSGIGIPPEAVDKVTIQYFTVGEQPSGSGLGLAIAKEVIALHDGELDIVSPPEGSSSGTEVNVRLPVVEPPAVLLVDDDADILDVMQNQFERQGYRCMRASGGLEALDMVTRLQPDAVVLDIVLPEMDGTEFILKMKSSKDLMRVPIVVVTAAHLGRAKAEILNSFSIPAFGKPWDEDELFDCIAEAFMGSATLSRKPVTASNEVRRAKRRPRKEPCDKET